jgi:hypothetical protein
MEDLPMAIEQHGVRLDIRLPNLLIGRKGKGIPVRENEYNQEKKTLFHEIGGLQNEA